MPAAWPHWAGLSSGLSGSVTAHPVGSEAQAPGALGSQALRRASVGTAPTWCGLKRPQEGRGCCPGSGLWVRRAGPRVHPGTQRALPATEAFAGSARADGSTKPGLGSPTTHPSQKLPANTNLSAHQLPSDGYLPGVGVGTFPCVSSDVPDPQSPLRLTRSHFKRTIDTAVCSVRGHSPRPVASHGSPPPECTLRASEASRPVLSSDAGPGPPSAAGLCTFFPWESVSGALPGPGFG